MKRFKVEVVWRKREARFDMVAKDVDTVVDKVFRRFGKKGIVVISTREYDLHETVAAWWS